jgi:transposase
MNRDALDRLSKEDLIALVLAQAAQIEALAQRVADLEARLGQPPKTPDNSSVPPSKGAKADRPATAPKKRRTGRPGTARALAEHPDHTVEAVAEACPHCRHALTPADQPEVHAYDHVELPVLKPTVTRVHRHRGTCPCCRARFAAPVPAGLEPGSPFGPNLGALVIHLHVTQAIGFERLARLMGEVFGIAISEGALVNIVRRAAEPLAQAADGIAAEVRQATVVASDETSARVCGATWWQWVLLSSTAVYHVIADSRAAAVIVETLRGAVPEVWVSDRYAAQAGHGREHQLCLAHLARDAQYALDEGDTVFAAGFKGLLKRAMAIGRRRDALQDGTLRQYRADLDRRLDKLLATRPTQPAAHRLWKAMCRQRDDLFRFVTRRDVPYTNNASERALRPSVIFRKVTGCFRSVWGAATYANAASVIATGRLRGKTALQAIADALAKPLTLKLAPA